MMIDLLMLFLFVVRVMLLVVLPFVVLMRLLFVVLLLVGGVSFVVMATDISVSVGLFLFLMFSWLHTMMCTFVTFTCLVAF